MGSSADCPTTKVKESSANVEMESKIIVENKMGGHDELKDQFRGAYTGRVRSLEQVDVRVHEEQQRK